ncbi:MAG TPA: hypothetical protein DIW80_07305 [Gordonia polyisoprenivorans]|uniref:hypothetical protein n=1 Tax=uncultured Gordonia sp. TaxID=198437 RepID=UPI000EDDFEE0|nr:hypothetical protein [uncultured Gordonia sp.]MBE7195458.1 hypothetical protein [Gordonia polyisoprenivorans]HCS57055.1 hypothetical protein [Gordonia polyisoprenivorans]
MSGTDHVTSTDDALPQRPSVLRVLVYSDDADTRRQVIGALGTRPVPDLPELSFLEVATGPMVFAQLDAGNVDVAILDGEASPEGGLGIAKQMSDEYDPRPPTLVLIGRAADRWLADWSRADAAATLPVDPIELPAALGDMLRGRLSQQQS